MPEWFEKMSLSVMYTSADLPRIPGPTFCDIVLLAMSAVDELTEMPNLALPVISLPVIVASEPETTQIPYRLLSEIKLSDETTLEESTAMPSLPLLISSFQSIIATVESDSAYSPSRAFLAISLEPVIFTLDEERWMPTCLLSVILLPCMISV